MIAGDLKRRHSWSSEVDYQPAETEAVATPGVDPAGLSSDDEDRGSYRVSRTISLIATAKIYSAKHVHRGPLRRLNSAPGRRTMSPLFLEITTP